MENKKAEFGFIWIFAILAGVAILLFMIYGATKIIDTSQVIEDTKLAAILSSNLDLLEAGSAQSIQATIRLNKPTNLSIGCFEVGYGDNRIQVSSGKSGSNEWSTGEEIVVSDKYIFSDRTEASKVLEINSRPFSYPYKIADLIFITSTSYCFVDTPSEIMSLYSSLKGISFDNCTRDQTSVCFGAYGCNISVEGLCTGLACNSEYDYGTVRKDGRSIPYADSLLLAAIISDSQTYECNVKRLMFRGGKIAEILLAKSQITRARGCNTALDSYLELLALSFPNYDSSDFLSNTESILEIDRLNNQEVCGLW